MTNPLVELALKVALEAHEGQTRWDGTSYIHHPLAVHHMVNLFKDKHNEFYNSIRIVALLHDVLEDTKVTIDDLEKHGFPPNVLESIRILTKMGKPNYWAYIKYIINTGDSVAIVVKLFDMLHNLLETPDDKRSKPQFTYKLFSVDLLLPEVAKIDLNLYTEALKYYMRVNTFEY